MMFDACKIKRMTKHYSDNPINILFRSILNFLWLIYINCGKTTCISNINIEHPSYKISPTFNIIIELLNSHERETMHVDARWLTRVVHALEIFLPEPSISINVSMWEVRNVDDRVVIDNKYSMSYITSHRRRCTTYKTYSYKKNEKLSLTQHHTPHFSANVHTS